MSMLERIKKKKLAGFKEFVESLEQSSRDKFSQISSMGLLEDPIYMTWVIKNLRTFDDFMKLPGDEIEAILKVQDQMMVQFAKCFDAVDPALLENLRGLIPRLVSSFENERAYIQNLTPQERNAARSFMVKTVRKLQANDVIKGFPWALPPMDLFYPKTLEDGLCTIRYESYHVAAEGEIFKGKKTSAWKHYYERGTLMAEGNYFDGMKIGKWTFYYPDGRLKAEGKYKMDMKVGAWREVDRQGQEATVEYLEGAKVA